MIKRNYPLGTGLFKRSLFTKIHYIHYTVRHIYTTQIYHVPTEKLSKVSDFDDRANLQQYKLHLNLIIELH
jgi:hypothetical protein